MSRFDAVIMVDWSGGNDRGAQPKKDAIWIGEAGSEPLYLRNRQLAEAWLVDRIERAIAQEERLLIGFDFPFGFPSGFARAVTGSDDPFALWDWLESRIEDVPTANNRWEVAGALNRLFPGTGPFWGNGGKADVPDLPRKGRTRDFDGLPERRRVEKTATRAFPVWQLAGAGAVGSQVLMGLPVLARLRRRFLQELTVWPFEAAEGQIVLAEIWPSILNDLVKTRTGPEDIRDAVQVSLIAEAFAAVSEPDLAAMLAVRDAEEGWILGLGHEAVLQAALLAPAPPPLANDCFALPAGVDWTPVESALARLQDVLRPVVGTEMVALDAAAGRVLAEDLRARRSHPDRSNAAVDGFGFAFDALGSGDQSLPLVSGRAAAGQPFAGVVPPGQALRILTGAPLPDGVDTVVLEEECRVTSAAIGFRSGLKRGANTRRAGEDFAVGDRVAEAGTRLRTPDLALLAAAGCAELPVYRQLKVAVLSTGDELVAPDDAGPGTVDANRPMLRAMAQAWGYDVVDLGCAPDRADNVRAALDRGAADADVIVTSGGASAGDEDHISALLRKHGTLTAWRIALKPGRPLALAMWQGVPVFGLPGNPVAALVCSLIFARPALSVLAGGPWLEPLAMVVPAAFSKRKKPGRREYLRARLTPDGAAEVFASEGSGRISGLAWASGLVELGDGAQEISPGDPVRFLPYAGFGL